jgi:hypothetical protein
MPAKLSETLRKYAKGRLIFVLFLLDGFISGFVLPKFEAFMRNNSGGAGPIDLMFFYTPEKAYSMVAAYGEYVRPAYRTVELTVDIIYPIVYTLFFSLLITRLFKKGFTENSAMQKLNVMPFGAWLFDLLENLGIVTMLSIYPSTPAMVAWLTTIFTMVKWLFAGASILLILIGIVAAIAGAFRKK